jgi:hypothetical protein
MSLNGFALMVALLHKAEAGAPRAASPRSRLQVSARLTVADTCKLLRTKNGRTIWKASEPVRVERRLVQGNSGSRTLLITLLF